MSERNSKLFYQIADVIETYPERYRQQIWGAVPHDAHGTPLTDENGDQILDTVIFDGVKHTCGTSHCIAGWAAALNDDKVLPTSGPYARHSDYTFIQIIDDGTIISTSDWATQELGLTYSEANLLFAASWRPVDNMSASDALRALGDGASIESVTHPDIVEFFD